MKSGSCETILLAEMDMMGCLWVWWWIVYCDVMMMIMIVGVGVIGMAGYVEAPAT